MQMSAAHPVMHSCRVIICEKSSHWAAALRSELAGTAPEVVETRSLTACEGELSQSPASLLVLETTLSNVETILDFIGHARRVFPSCTIAGLLTPETSAIAPLLREAGAIEVISSVLASPRLARLARRQFALAPEPELSLRELAFEHMPWPAHASPHQRESA